MFLCHVAETTTTNPPVTTAPPTIVTIPFIECPAVPCPADSICLEGVCQCRSGTFLQDGHCVPAQVFPGELHFTNREFKVEMSDRTSEIFRKTAHEISAALYEALKDVPGYQRSEVVRLEEGSVRATVNNIFENTNTSEDDVKDLIETAINKSSDTGGVLSGASFTPENLCDVEPLPCDSISAKCTHENGRARCSCKTGYIPTMYSNTICRGCPSGQEPDGDKCKSCKFGYGGFNCNDSSLLAVVVVSCVLGGILLILVLAVISYHGWRRYSKRKPDDSSSPYSIGESWPAGVNPISRATTKWNSTRSMEMREAAYTDVLGDRTQQTNSAVSYHMFSRRLCRLNYFPLILRLSHASCRPSTKSVCSMLPRHLASRSHLLINLKPTQ
ncbi:protein HEG-like [Chaetodon trifascialis]|uniref:protein HEG-like n=1 Tax=Chaetodon trifascialis TaxID=109706 RepID=UPI0039912630